MRKLLVMLLVCILVFSITVSLTSCWWRKKPDEPPKTDDPTVDDTPDNTVDDGSGISNGKIKLPAIKIPGLVPEE